jgi:SAM-dependent methyltransferase
MEASFDPSQWDRFAFSSRKTPEYMHYRLLECGRCDLLYANPLPKRESLEMAYRDAAFDSGEESRLASATYAQFLPRILAKIPHRGAALDIGTGDGAFLSELERHGFHRVTGVEPSRAPIDAADPTIRDRIMHGPFRAADFAKQSFSLISCFQTMEHVYDPLALCRDAFELLRPGGALFFVCHDRRALSARILRGRSPIFDIEHLQLFSRRSLRFLLHRTGYEAAETPAVVNRYPLSYWLKLFPLPTLMKARAIAASKRNSLGSIQLALAAGNFAAVAYKR